ncbi:MULTISPECIES: NUDIX domain-containing protein [unclassified Mycobacterium]|uniref:nucleotide triphosphate diphosphatase NUDT15 n=1 Tax=unclassified Mycobacterium TaxID=2642494 RepID=UPI000993F33C|nr:MULTISPECIES: NUDIX domain-containing protein [unclassified Mycobacterium]
MTNNREMCDRPHPGVGCFVLRDGRFLMGRRHGAHGAGMWSVPGGWIERGESPESAAIREVWEETGVRITHPRAVGATTTVHPEGLCSLTVWVVSRWDSGEPASVEPDKFVELRWCTWEEGLPAPLFDVWTDLLASPTYAQLREVLAAASAKRYKRP